MDRLETELQHLLNLISPPFSQGWRAFVWDKAKRLAEQDPEFSSLPERLASSAQRQNSTSSEKPGEQLGTGEPERRPADTSMTAQLASTGRRPTSSREGL